jgi:hypothetical protein
MASSQLTTDTPGSNELTALQSSVEKTLDDLWRLSVITKDGDFGKQNQAAFRAKMYVVCAYVMFSFIAKRAVFVVLLFQCLCCVFHRSFSSWTTEIL